MWSCLLWDIGGEATVPPAIMITIMIMIKVATAPPAIAVMVMKR